MRVKYQKLPVGVSLYVRRDGKICPRSFLWKDNQTYKIDRVIRTEKAASTKVGGCGTRYTVMVQGLPRYLYNEEGKWFMEDEIYEEDKK